MTVAEVSRQEGIGVQTLYNWRDKAKQQGRPVPGSKPTSEHWSAEAKFATVLETASLNEAEFGIITAENPMQNPLSSEENKNRNDILRSDLRRGNLGFVQIKGKYGVIENPFFVMNITKTMCIELGNKYNQESVILGSKQDNDGGLYSKFEYIEGETTTQERSVVIGSGDELEKCR